jgi:uncharacterized protein involved in type VI secretion and phage assembly
MSDRMLAAIQRVVQAELAQQRTALLGVVTAVYVHETEDDANNFEVDVRLKHAGLELRQVPMTVSYMGIAIPPDVGDLVLVHFIDGDLNQAVVSGRFYHADERPPLHKAGDILFEQRLADDTFNHLRLAADGAIYIQRDVTKREDNSEAKAGIAIDPDGNIAIKTGDKVTITVGADGNISIDCEKLTINADVEISKTLKVASDTTVDTQVVVGAGPKTTIKGGEIQGG